MRKTLEVPNTSYAVREPAELTGRVATLSLGSDLAIATPQIAARSQHNSAGSGTIRLKIRQRRSSYSERLEDHSDDDLSTMTTSWIQKINQERIRNSEAAIISKVMQSTALPEFGLQRTERGLQVYIGLEERYWDGPPGSWIPSPPIWNCRRNYLFPVPQHDADKIPGITRYVIMRENGLYTPEEAALLRGMWLQYRNLKESQDPVNLRRSWNSPTYVHIMHINEYSADIEDYLNPHSTMYQNLSVCGLPARMDQALLSDNSAAQLSSRNEAGQDCLTQVHKWVTLRCSLEDNTGISTRTTDLYKDYCNDIAPNTQPMDIKVFSSHLKILHPSRYDANNKHRSSYKGIVLLDRQALTSANLQIHDLVNDRTGDGHHLPVPDSDTLTQSSRASTGSQTSNQSQKMAADLESVQTWINEHVVLTNDATTIARSQDLYNSYCRSSPRNMSYNTFTKCLNMLYLEKRTRGPNKTSAYRGFQLKS